MQKKMTKRELLLRIVAEYQRAYGIADGDNIDPDDLTKWAIKTKRMESHEASLFRQSKRELMKALKEEEVTDEQGRRIPKMAAIRIKGNRQTRLFDFLAAKPRKALTALAQQKRSLVAYARKIKLKRDSYNDNNNLEPNYRCSISI